MIVIKVVVGVVDRTIVAVSEARVVDAVCGGRPRKERRVTRNERHQRGLCEAVKRI